MQLLQFLNIIIPIGFPVPVFLAWGHLLHSYLEAFVFVGRTGGSSSSSSSRDERETLLLATEATVQLAVLQCAALCLLPPCAVFCPYLQAVNSAWHRPKADDIFALGTETMVRRHCPGPGFMEGQCHGQRNSDGVRNLFWTPVLTVSSNQ